MTGIKKEATIFFAVAAGIALIPVSAAYGQQMGLPVANLGALPMSAKVPTQSEGFFPRLLNSMQKTKTSTLWSTYPANIRGQVFSNKEPSLSPAMGGGW